MKICVLGAGWFGCYIANELINKGYDTTVYEKEKDLFSGASGNNQNRLHLGYHYPRSLITRELSKKGFFIFKKKLKNFTKKVNKNFYALATDKKNKINSETFISILKKGKLNYKKVNQKDKKNFQNLHCFIQCKEETILLDKAKKYYKKKLRKNILFNFCVKKIKKKFEKYIIENKEYDVVINCTSLNYNYKKHKINNLIYEHCAIMLYKSLEKNHPAITIMDGPYFTLYPWDSQNKYGLYSVKNSRVLSNKNFNTLKKNVKNKINNKYLRVLRNKIEKNFSYFYPNFKTKFKFIKYLRSYRTISKNKYDTRACAVYENKKFINVFPGKIDHIFYAFNEIERCLKKF